MKASQTKKAWHFRKMHNRSHAPSPRRCEIQWWPSLERLEERCLLATVIDLGSALGWCSSVASAINDKGEIVGGASTYCPPNTSEWEGHGFVWLEGMETNLGNNAGALGINELGDAVGKVNWDDVSSSASLWKSGGQSTLLPGLGGDINIAHDINDAGQIAGAASTADGYHAVLWENGDIHDLHPDFAAQSYAWGINPAGHVVGYLYHPQIHPFIWKNGVITDLGFNGGALDISSSGLVVGWGGNSQGFVWEDGRIIRDLDGTGYGVSNSCQIVGVTESNDEPFFDATVWHGNETIDLNTLLPAGSEWHLKFALDINEKGQIVAVGTREPGGHEQAFLIDDWLDMTVASLTAKDSRTITIEYDILTDRLVGSTFDIEVYETPTRFFDSEDNYYVGSITISGDYTKPGRHALDLEVPGGIPLVFSEKTGKLHHYVTGVVDPNGVLSDVVINDNCTAGFRKYVVAAVTPGFNRYAWFAGGSYPCTGILGVSWPYKLHEALVEHGYDKSLVFDEWKCALPDPSGMELGSIDLTERIRLEVAMIVEGGINANDVIDLHLIGHSRGAVLSNWTMQRIAAAEIVPQFAAGFKQLTLLDPHPANNMYPVGSVSNEWEGYSMARRVGAFQAAAMDPGIDVPARVDHVQLYWQHTTTDLLSGIDNQEKYLNLWGLSPEYVVIDAGTTEDVVNLTDVSWNTWAIGHIEVTEWYQSCSNPDWPSCRREIESDRTIALRTAVTFEDFQLGTAGPVTPEMPLKWSAANRAPTEHRRSILQTDPSEVGPASQSIEGQDRTKQIRIRRSPGGPSVCEITLQHEWPAIVPE